MRAGVRAGGREGRRRRERARAVATVWSSYRCQALRLTRTHTEVVAAAVLEEAEGAEKRSGRHAPERRLKLVAQVVEENICFRVHAAGKMRRLQEPLLSVG